MRQYYKVVYDYRPVIDAGETRVVVEPHGMVIVVSENYIDFPVKPRAQFRNLFFLVRAHAEVAEKPRSRIGAYDRIEVLYKVFVHPGKIVISHNQLAVFARAGVPRPIAVFYDVPVVEMQVRTKKHAGLSIRTTETR